MADDLEDLDEAVRRHDPDRWLASRFIADREERADVIALYAFNHELARVAGAVSNPLMGEIRLTWWAEAVAEIYEGRPVRKHPVTLALAQAVLRRGLPREALDNLVEARFPELDGAAVDEGPLMVLAARALGVEHAGVAAVAAGRLTEAKQIPAKAFPAVAHLALQRVNGPLARRVAITWAVIRGRV